MKTGLKKKIVTLHSGSLIKPVELNYVMLHFRNNKHIEDNRHLNLKSRSYLFKLSTISE